MLSQSGMFERDKEIDQVNIRSRQKPNACTGPSRQEKAGPGSWLVSGYDADPV